METIWHLLILFGLVGLLTHIGTEPTFIPPSKETNDDEETDENWEQQDLWKDDPWVDDIYTDPSFYWMPGNIYYTGDDDERMS